MDCFFVVRLFLSSRQMREVFCAEKSDFAGAPYYSIDKEHFSLYSGLILALL